MSFFMLLKEVEKLGYTVLTYEEAKEQLKITPEEFGGEYIFLSLNNKKYLLLNNISQNTKIFITEFLKSNKLKKIKNTLYSILENNIILEHKRSL